MYAIHSKVNVRRRWWIVLIVLILIRTHIVMWKVTERNNNFDSYLSLLASSMKGLFCISESNFHSAPNLFDISELCIFGFSVAIFRRCPLDHTMKAFIGRLMWLEFEWSIEAECDLDVNDVILLLISGAFGILKIFIPSSSRIFFD